MPAQNIISEIFPCSPDQSIHRSLHIWCLRLNSIRIKLVGQPVAHQVNHMTLDRQYPHLGNSCSNLTCVLRGGVDKPVHHFLHSYNNHCSATSAQHLLSSHPK